MENREIWRWKTLCLTNDNCEGYITHEESLTGFCRKPIKSGTYTPPGAQMKMKKLGHTPPPGAPPGEVMSFVYTIKEGPTELFPNPDLSVSHLGHSLKNIFPIKFRPRDVLFFLEIYRFAVQRAIKIRNRFTKNTRA